MLASVWQATLDVALGGLAVSLLVLVRGLERRLCRLERRQRELERSRYGACCRD